MALVDRQRESGSVLIWILVLVAIFAALGAFMSQGTRSNENGLSKMKAQLLANELMDQAAFYKRAWQEMRMSCSAEEIDLDSIPSTPYTRNPNTPPDMSCSLFNFKASGIGEPKIDNKYIVDIPTGYWDPAGSRAEYWFANQTTRVFGVGSDTKAEIALTARLIREDICREYNKLVLGDPTIQVYGGDWGDSTYSGGDGTTIWDSIGGNLQGKMSFCMAEYGGSRFLIHQILEPR
ncbi:MAG: hypothetical protein GW769_14790 [Alphaproteobacteria bacterium]|nr:hypothetical protein [Alphaproteobacteria bacterium]